MPLEDYKPYLTNLVTGLAGGAAGGGLGYFGTKQLSDEDDDTFGKRRRSNMAIGALSGGAAGAAIPSALRAFIPGEESTLSKIVDAPGKAVSWAFGAAPKLPIAGMLTGAGAGAGAGLFARRMAGVGDTLQGKLDALKATAQGLKDKWTTTGQNLESAWKGHVSSAEALAKSRADALKGMKVKTPAAVSAAADARARYEGMLKPPVPGSGIPPAPEHQPYHDWQAHIGNPPADMTAAEKAVQEFETHMKADQGMSWRKFVPFAGSPAEKALSQTKGTGWAWKAPRVAARAGGVAGLAAGIWGSHFLND